MKYHICWDDWEDGVTGSTKVEADNIGSAYCMAVDHLNVAVRLFSEGDIQSISYEENGERKFIDKLEFLKDSKFIAQLREYENKNKKHNIIREANVSSLLYQIKEKIAYRLSEINPTENSISNWLKSEDFLETLINTPKLTQGRKLSLKSIEERLKNLEEEFKKDENKFVDYVIDYSDYLKGKT